jgi:hypothetical protein
MIGAVVDGVISGMDVPVVSDSEGGLLSGFANVGVLVGN